MNNSLDKQVVAQALQIINSAQTITLLTHKNPDPDGISACAALSEWLQSLGKSVETIYVNQTDYVLAVNPAGERINNHSRISDLLIACDTANYERLYFPEVFKAIPLINIDHHVSNSIMGTVNLVDGTVSSTCEYLVTIFKAWNVKITKTIAEALLYGMLYDTQIFQTQPTNAQTLRVAAELIDAGAHIFKLKLLLEAYKTSKNIKFWGSVLQRLTLLPHAKAVIATVTKEDLGAAGVDRSAFLGLNNFISTLTDIDIMIFMYEEESGKTKVSLRSKTADVNVLAGKFNGGGHKYAAGFLSDRSIDDLVQEITVIIEQKAY